MRYSIEQLQKVIGYTFSDPSLLTAALTHRSVESLNYERLEFLGDSIVNFVIAEAVYLKFRQAQEGELSRLRASFVREETLADLAREMDLGQYLNLGAGELKSGGRDRASILADAFEALIGALYLDAGFAFCQERLLAWFDSRLKMSTIKKSHKDPKTQLQEWLQSKSLNLPVYEVVEVLGLAHEQTFSVSCRLNDLNYTTHAEHSTRRKAEQEAALKMLHLLENKK